MKINNGFVKRALAFLLCAVMLFGSAPLNGLAALDFSRLEAFNMDFTPVKSFFGKLADIRLPGIFGTKAAAEGEEETPTSGYCGFDRNGDGEPDDNLTWEYSDSAKTLYINGEGEMQNYSPADPAPWYAFRNEVEIIEFNTEGLRSIGYYAFYNFAHNNFIINSSVPSYLFDSSIGGNVASNMHWQYRQPDEYYGELIIEGSGAMPDYNPDTAPWSGLLNSEYFHISRIRIEGSVTSIGNYAFYNASLYEINIPESVTSIGDRAFYNACLYEINIPESVTSIGESAFGGFGFDIYNGRVFADVWTYDYSQKVLYIGNEYPSQTGNYSPDDPAPWYAFRNEVESIEFSEFAEIYVGDYAFYDFTALKDLYIPSNVCSLGAYSFGRSFDPVDDSNFEWSLSTDIMNNSSYPTIYYLDVGILMQGLEKVFIDSTLSGGISETAFDKCFSLKEVYCRGGSFPADNIRNAYKEYCKNYLSRQQPELKAIDLYSYIPSAISSFVNNYFNNNAESAVVYSCGNNYYIPRYPNPDPRNPVGEGCVINVLTGLNYIGKNKNILWAADGNTLFISGSGVCGDGVNPVVFGVNQSGIDTISFSDDITAVADNAFCNFNKIQYMLSSGGVQSVGENAFGTNEAQLWHYADFENGIFYSGWYIHRYNEDGTKPEESWLIRTNPEASGCSVIYTTTIIAGGAAKNSALKYINIPESVKHIGKNAVDGCDNFICAIYAGDEDGWAEIEIEPEGNEALGRVSFGGYRYQYSEDVFAVIYRENGRNVLFIYGTGVIDNISPFNDEEKSSVSALVIDEGITGIAGNAFDGFVNVESVSLPDSIQKIGSHAFDGTKLFSDWESGNEKALFVDNCLARVMPGAVGELNIGADIICIADGAFEGCTQLEGITVAQGNWRYSSAGECLVDSWSETLIAGCNNSVIPDDGSVREIADRAFYGCAGLTSVTIPEGVTTIGASAFENCVNLENITFPDSLENIGVNAFKNTAYKNNPGNWTKSPFGFSELYLGKNLLGVRRGTSEKDYYIINEPVQSVTSDTFAELTGVYSVYIMNRNTVLPDDVFSGLPSGCVVYYFGTQAEWNSGHGTVDLTGVSLQCVYDIQYSGNQYINQYFMYSQSNNTITINGLTDRGKTLKVVRIPDELNGMPVREIKKEAFKNETNIEALYIPKRTTESNEFSIGYSAFRECKNLSYVFIDVNLVTSSNFSAFEKIGYVEMVFGKNVQRIGIGIQTFGGFLNSTAKIRKLVIMSEDIQSFGSWGLALKNLRTAGPLGGGYDFEFGWENRIPAKAFSICANLTKITIPASVKSIGSSAFGSCGSNTQVYYDGTLADWCGISFADATANPAATANVRINGTNISAITVINAADIDGITRINSYTFYKWSWLKGIDIPGTVTSIGNSAFYGCTGLEHVVIPDSVKIIGSSAFSGCIMLDEFTVPATVTYIGSNAFYDIFNVVYEGNATGSPWGAKAVNGYIRDYENPEGGKYRLVYEDSDRTVLLGCSVDAAGTVTVPRSVDYVGDRAFANCSRIEQIIYNADEPDYGNDVYAGCNAAIKYTTTDVLARDVIFGDEGTRLIFCSKVRDGKYSVPAGVEVIEDYAFANCKKIKAEIPGNNSILSVGANAFFNTPETQKTDTETAPDENGVYYELTLIGTILLDVVPKLPEPSGEDEPVPDEEPEFVLDLSGTNITCIAAGALANCGDVTKVVLPGSLKGISHNAFDGCANLETIDGGANLEYVGKDAFSGTKLYSDWADGNEKALYIGGCLVKVRQTASGNFAVASGKTCIADSAFEGCESVTKVTVPEGVTRIGNRAFAGCTGLKSVALPDKLKVIESEAFEGCTALTSVELPATLTRLGGRALFGCTALESIAVTGNTENPVFVSYDGILFRNKTTDENKTEKHLVVYPPAKADADYEIPAGKADVFDNFAFVYCNNLNSVTFHGVSYRTVAFYECNAARISDNLKDGVELCEDGTMLMQVTADALDENGSFTVPEGIIAISGAAFSSMKEQLRGIDLNGALIINDDAFRGCVNLERVNGSEDVIHVGANAFNGCAKLGEIDLSGAETICGGAFSGCTLLDNENTVISGKAIVAKDAFDFGIDSNINIVTYSSGSATGSAVPDDLIITVDYGGNVTLNCSTEISLESSNGIIRRIAWVNAETGEMLDGDGDGVTIENLKGDIEVKAVIYEENGTPEDVELLAESEPVKITVGSIPVEINNGESSVTCEFCSILNLTLPENMADGTITWYKYVDGGTPEAMNIDEPVTHDITVYASIEKDGRTYKSQNIEVNVKAPEIDYTETGTEELELKTVTLSVNLSDKESGSRISDAIAGKFTFEWYKDGKKVGEGTEHTFRNVSKSFDVTVKVKFNGTEIDEYKYTVNIKEQTVIVNEPSIKVINTGKTKTVDLKSTVTFTADVKYKPDDAKIQWYKDGKAVKGENGNTFKVEKAESDYTVQAKLVDATGKELCKSETQTVKVKTGFFAIIIAFFRQIFGRLPDVKWEEVK